MNIIDRGRKIKDFRRQGGRRKTMGGSGQSGRGKRRGNRDLEGVAAVEDYVAVKRHGAEEKRVEVKKRRNGEGKAAGRGRRRRLYCDQFVNKNLVRSGTDFKDKRSTGDLFVTPPILLIFLLIIILFFFLVLLFISLLFILLLFSFLPFPHVLLIDFAFSSLLSFFFSFLFYSFSSSLPLSFSLVSVYPLSHSLHLTHPPLYPYLFNSFFFLLL